MPLGHLSDAGASWTVTDPARLATQIRLRAVGLVAPQGFGYLGQALSSAEQVAALFATMVPGKDRLVCSPGHYVIAVYAAAAQLGLITEEEARTYGQNDSGLESIGTERSPIVDYVCGSLGQGLSAAAGFALSDRLHGASQQHGASRPHSVGRRTFAMVSDGELEEGQVWEAAMFAAHHRLGSLTVLIDANNSQVDGPVDTITTIEPIAAKWESFGWRAVDIDGHDVHAIISSLRRETGGEPVVVICRTSTGHGLDCLPEDADGHFIKLPPDLAARAAAELTQRLAAP
jgi:transketolase